MTWDPEGLAAWLYEITGFDVHAPPGPEALAKRLFGPDGIVSVDGRKILGDAALMPRVQLALELPPPPHTQEWEIWIRRRLPTDRYRFGIAHEIAEWILHFIDYDGDDVEAYANALAAAILIPRNVYLRELDEVGFDLPLLAGLFNTTESCIALRHGEVTDQPIALVRETDVVTRGREIEWPDEREIRKIAKTDGWVEGVLRFPLTDRRRRMALLVLLTG